MATGSDAEGAVPFRKRLNLLPDRVDELAHASVSGYLEISRDHLSVLHFDEQFRKALSYEHYEFPYCQDNGRWAEVVSQIIVERSEDLPKAIVVDDVPCSLIPSDLFPDDKDALGRIMDLEHDRVADHILCSDPLNAFDAQCIALVPHELMSMMPSAQMIPAFSAWTPSLIRRPAPFHAHLHISAQSFRLALLAGRGLLLHNSQPYDTATDVLYFTMAALEQLSILHTEVTLTLYGNVQVGDEAHELLSRYIATVALAERPTEFMCSYSFKDLPSHTSPYLLNAPLCAS